MKHLMKKVVNNKIIQKNLCLLRILFFFTRNFFSKNKKIFNSKSYPYKIDRINFIDIDDKFTFELAKSNEFKS